LKELIEDLRKEIAEIEEKMRDLELGMYYWIFG